MADRKAASISPAFCIGIDFNISPRTRDAGSHPSELGQPQAERRETTLPVLIACRGPLEQANAPHPIRRLRVGGEWPCQRRTTEQRDERAPLHAAFPWNVRTTPCRSKHSIARWSQALHND